MVVSQPGCRKSDAPSQVDSRANFSLYLPLSGGDAPLNLQTLLTSPVLSTRAGIRLGRCPHPRPAPAPSPQGRFPRLLYPLVFRPQSVSTSPRKKRMQTPSFRFTAPPFAPPDAGSRGANQLRYTGSPVRCGITPPPAAGPYNLRKRSAPPRTAPPQSRTSARQSGFSSTTAGPKIHRERRLPPAGDCPT